MKRFMIEFEGGKVVFEAQNKERATDIAYKDYSEQSIHSGYLYQVINDEDKDLICALS